MASGGWIEHIEFEIKTRCDDGTENPDSELERFAHRTLDMTATHGHNFNISDDTANCMREAGLTDVREIRFKIPLGWWSADPKYKEVGRFYERYFKTGLQGWCMQVYTKNMGVRWWDCALRMQADRDAVYTGPGQCRLPEGLCRD